MGKQKITKSMLQNDLKNLSLSDIASKYGITDDALDSLLSRYNLHHTVSKDDTDRRRSDENDVIDSGISAFLQEADFGFGYDIKHTYIVGVDITGYANAEDLAGIIRAELDDLSDTADGSQWSTDMCNLGKEGNASRYVFAFHNATAGFTVKEKILPVLKRLQHDPKLYEGKDAYFVFNARAGKYYPTIEALFTDVVHTLNDMKDPAFWKQYDAGTSEQEDASPELAEPLSVPLVVAEEIAASLPEDAEDIPASDVSSDGPSIVLPELPDDNDLSADAVTPEAIHHSIHLVDSENVNASWSDILDDDPDTETLVLYTDNTPKISYDDMKDIMTHDTGLRLIKVDAGEKGRNALDFQLVSLMGFLIATHPDYSFMIISADSGYDPVVGYWKEKGYDVRRLPMLNHKMAGSVKPYIMLSADEKKQLSDGCVNKTEKAFHTPSAPEKTAHDGKTFDKKAFIRARIPDRSDEVYDTVIQILDAYDAKDAPKMHRDFTHAFGHNGDMLFKKIAKVNGIKTYKKL